MSLPEKNFWTSSDSINRLVAKYMIVYRLEPEIARAAAMIVVRERAGYTRDRTQAEEITMEALCIKMEELTKLN